jgi:hypothetical protein
MLRSGIQETFEVTYRAPFIRSETDV